MASHLHPGPQDTSVLELQDYHVSQHVWQERKNRLLRVRRSQKVKHHDPDQRMLPYLEQAGFLGVAHLGYCTIDHSLITALVERWRPETHTFHMPTGECTITLEDIGIISGLPVDGHAVTGRTHHVDWMGLCDQLLGNHPGPRLLKGARVDMAFFWEGFSREFDDDDDEEYVQQCTRAYMLRLIGGLLFPDHSGKFVHLMFLTLLEDFATTGTYSWGSAVLAYLYRELCKATNYEAGEIGGACIFLQYWAWSRFPPIAPTLVMAEDARPMRYIAGRDHIRPLGFQWHKHKVLSDTVTGVLEYYRRFFDQLKTDEIVWQPYNDAIIESLPQFSVASRSLGRSLVPLIFFHIVEWQHPDRVMRQFGMDQPIPRRPRQREDLHDLTLKGRIEEDWSQHHAVYIQTWDARMEMLVTGQPLVTPLTSHSEYMRWYKNITRRWMSRTGASLGRVADIAEQCFIWSTDPSSGFSMAKLREAADEILHSLREHDRTICEQLRAAPTAETIPGPVEDDDNEQPRMRRRRRSGLATHRTRLRDPEDDDSSTRHTTFPSSAATSTTATAAYPPSQPPPGAYPPYPSYPPHPYPPAYSYPPYPYPPYPYPPPGYPYPPYPSQPGPSSGPSHWPPHSSDPGPSS